MARDERDERPSGAETLRGVVEATNEKGIKIGERWLNYSQFRQVTPPEVGQEVEVELDRGRFIHYGKSGEFASHRREDQELSMLSLHLLQIALVLVNTLMFQRVLGEERWANALGADELRALSPLIYGHVNPYGVFDLDLSTRLPIEATA
jgi:Tn3 transposase DDE domain